MVYDKKINYYKKRTYIHIIYHTLSRKFLSLYRDFVSRRTNMRFEERRSDLQRNKAVQHNGNEGYSIINLVFVPR